MGIMGAGSCGQKALDKIGAAKQAVEDARTAEAPQYAPDEFRSAEESLILAQDEYDKYRFRSSEAEAIKAEAEARNALEIALAERARLAEQQRKLREQEEAERLAYNVSSLYGSTLTEPTEEEMARTALHDVHFAYDSSGLSEAADTILEMNAKWLADHPAINVEIEGHTDERGTDDYNQGLGARRARSVYDRMLKLGIDASRMRTVSYGESVPLDPASTEEAWAKNRRVHFAVIQ
jgi:peptidoglycan-associated lipoprotein